MAPSPPATPVMPARDAEGQRLVQRDVDAHGGGRDLVVADRHEGAARARAQQVHREDVDRDRDDEREVIQPHVLRHRQAERRIRLGDDEALHAAGPVLEEVQLQQLRHRGGEREGRKREIDAGQPQRRLAEQEAEAEADHAGDRQRQRVVDVERAPSAPPWYRRRPRRTRSGRARTGRCRRSGCSAPAPRARRSGASSSGR